MAGILSLLGRGHEPMPRMGHTAWPTHNKVLVHGGLTKDYSENSKRRLASVVEVFDTYAESWQQKEVTGEAPVPGVHAAASASVDDDLFSFGGYDGSRWNNSLHKLKHASEWIELCPQNKSPESPMAKSDAGMVVFGDNLAVFGGFGIPHGPTQPGSSFIRYPDGGGWTNEFHIYNLSASKQTFVNNNVWISPDTTGERPPPCAAFTLTSIDNRRAVLFGGEIGEDRVMNDVYIIDLQRMHWTKLSKSGERPWPKKRARPWPKKRAYHAACCLNYGQQHPQLLVTGGWKGQGKPIGDAWILNVDSGSWRKVSGIRQPRWAHSITAFCLVDGVTEATMFGGSADPWTGSAEKLSKLADTTLLLFCCSDQSEWELRSVTPFSKLGSEERESVKKIQKRNQERQVEKRLQQAEERKEWENKRVQCAEKRVFQQQAIAAEQSLVPIRGADIVAKTTLEVIPGTPLTFEWEGHGMKLYVPAEALKPGTPTLTMTIQASLSGQYQLPDDAELVSGIYWVAFPRRFSRPVTMELQHCAYLEHPDQLSSLFFFTAKCNQKTLPYQFQPLPGGVFSTSISYGTIDLNHFSGVGVGTRRNKGKGRGGKKKDKVKEKRKKQEVEKSYTARVFYIPQVATTWLMHFTIVCDLELCLKEVEIFYKNLKAEPGPHLDVIFDSDEVVLEIPKAGETLPSGWTLQPLFYPPRLLRERVDNYKPGRTIHSCQVELVWKTPAERLSYTLHICGLRPAETSITITRDPSFPAESQQSQPHASAAEIRPDGDISQSTEAPTALSDFRQFGKPTMSLLMNLVGCNVKNKWREIGTGLGVKEADLTSIQAEEANKTDATQCCIQRVFRNWESAMTSEYTWQNLANVLRSPVVNEKSAVLELYKSLCEHNK